MTMANKDKAYSRFLNELKKTYTYISKEKKPIEDIGNLIESFDRYQQLRLKEERELNPKNMTFGLMNYIMESNVEKLLKDKKSLIKEYIELIKKDKNLSSQYMFISALQKYNLVNEAKNYINEALSLSSNKINRGGLYESNMKVYKFLKKNHIIKENIDNENRHFFENCDFLIKNKKKPSNLNQITKVINEASDYIEKHKKIVSESETHSIDYLINEYNQKYSSILNEGEKTLIQEMLNPTERNSEKKEKAFTSLKTECIELVNGMITESSIEDKENLLTLKEGLLSMEYNDENIIKDAAKLLEIKSVLSEK